MSLTPHDELLERAAERLRQSDCLVITAGAGMGVDSGLPDFRGRFGLWNIEDGRFIDVSTPWTFNEYPHKGWGFYGHFWNLCRDATPHEGFQALRQLAQRLPTWVFTSNVDGHFQRAGFDAERVVECHGSLGLLQCARRCSDALWSADAVRIEVDATYAARADQPLPSCPHCGGLARPNVCMFVDILWVARQTSARESAYQAWLTEQQQAGRRLTVLECGAGAAVPRVRREAEKLLERFSDACLIRINPDPGTEAPAGTITLPLGAREALLALGQRLLPSPLGP
jgi:NAD-dependent SIR2 family protein deacetylase